ncbi:DUF2931 family protein [Chryseobacterium sp. LC2016-29]|uniref:DUF2931 family protein n=1 Tax=Chryseobacterium sp. LC2016-29 TaxID=2897331 RepID=UPI001E3EB664|nr:DUF2931 family protein [Chryseobacterium sp. LC2016-29]MCD0478612.1 DUF2931 family protein [Chryseobacterium sp. LC2016-29]
MKDNPIVLNWLCMILFLSILMSSCQKTKYQWEAGISAPKYYPISDVRVGFENAGNGSLTSLDPGWGQTYGAVVGEKWKNIPKEVSIHYNSGAENYTYEGKVLLPQEKIRDLFNEYNLDDEDNSGHLVVGMAPGGWIRVWFQTIDHKADDLVNIEVAKVKLRGSYNNTADERYKVKNFENWGKYYSYWQHHGIPYEAWENNEKEYDMYFDFNNPNKRKVEFSYTSQDGTFEQGIGIWKKFRRKLPLEFELGWRDKANETFYCSKFVMPKGLKNFVEKKELNTIVFKLEIDDNDQDATLYLVTNNTKERILQFKNKQPTEEEKKNNEYTYTTEVEYFIP